SSVWRHSECWGSNELVRGQDRVSSTGRQRYQGGFKHQRRPVSCPTSQGPSNGPPGPFPKSGDAVLLTTGAAVGGMPRTSILVPSPILGLSCPLLPSDAPGPPA
ncbi:hypothetical protein MC885_009892, partial [Smutsia gigantea]